MTKYGFVNILDKPVQLLLMLDVNGDRPQPSCRPTGLQSLVVLLDQLHNQLRPHKHPAHHLRNQSGKAQVLSVLVIQLVQVIRLVLVIL